MKSDSLPVASGSPRAGGGRYCIVGAGTSGLAVAKNFLERGIPFDCFEREDDVGGNWYYGRPASSVYASTHLISSKRLTEYTDFPMPEEYPEFPSHRQVWDYLRSYARHFDLYETIQFNTSVKRVEPRGQGGWLVRLDDGREIAYRGLIIANGHNWDPKWPSYPGEFGGQVLHSCQYKTPAVLEGKRVLVVGAGNSGCDIAVESGHHARATYHSIRRGYHFLPKFLRGQPVDACGERLLRYRLPLWLRRMLAGLMTRIAVGTPQAYGLPRPDHKLFETHPIINSQLLYEVGHGRVLPKPDIARLDTRHVEFVDGTRQAIDLIIYATGFCITIPFIERALLNWRDGRPDLYLNIFHPERDDLFIAGLIQPDSGQWGLVDYQAQLIASYLLALDRSSRGARRFQTLKQSNRRDQRHGIRWIASSRHRLEVEHFSYRQQLRRHIRQLARGRFRR